MKTTLATIILLCLALPALAADRYVRKTGNDGSSTCSTGAPCLTIARGVQVMAGGETLYIGGGTYNERQIVLDKSGSAGSPTTLRAEGTGAVILKWPGAHDANREFFYFVDSLRFLVLDGLTLDGSDASGNQALGYLLAGNEPQDITVRNSVLRNSFVSCWVAHEPQRFTVEDNTFINCGADNDLDHGMYLGGSGHVIQRNTFIGPTAHHIQIRPYGTDFIITRNTFTGSRLGVLLTAGNVVFSNNFIYDDKWIDPDSAVYCVFGNDIKIWNNTFWNNGAWFHPTDCFGVNEFRNNIHAGTNSTLGDEAGGVVVGTNVTSDPGFVQAATGDLHLANDTNAAIDAGFTLAGVPVDIDGNPRVAGSYDIGADEFTGTGTVVYHLGLGTPPNSTTHINEVMVFAPSWEVHDAAHVIQTAGALGTTTMTLSLVTQPVGGVMTGTLTRAAVAGVATYDDLQFSVAGTYVIRATATLPSGVATSDSDAFVILALAAPVPTSLVFTAQPGDVAVGATMAPVVVQVHDQSGAPYLTAAVSVNLQIAANPAGGVLSGTRPKNSSTLTGDVMFTDLSLNALGTPYTLQASMAGPITVTSSPFAVTPAAPPPGTGGVRLMRGMLLAR